MLSRDCFGRYPQSDKKINGEFAPSRREFRRACVGRPKPLQQLLC
jgi:hypothetical protein